MKARTYICIDLRSFFASVECVERGLDPMTADLVVADAERSETTICLAASPSLRAKGVKNRCRLYELPKHLSYIIATPRMRKYIDYAAAVYGIYLRYISAEDIYVYSIDEAFLDVTDYMGLHAYTPREMARFLMSEIFRELGLSSAAGIGTNLYLAKIALDIIAKRSPDFIGELDEASYIRLLWQHRPLTDFWRIGTATARRLERMGLYTMEDIARADEDMLYREFGIDAEFLIDHACGRESTLISDIKAYRPHTESLSSGQVLMRDYSAAETGIIVREMLDVLCLDMVRRNVLCSGVVIYIYYSFNKCLPPSRGSVNISPPSNSDALIIPAVLALYDRIVLPDVGIRRINISCARLEEDRGVEQTCLFSGRRTEELDRDRRRQLAVIGIRDKYGKNALLKGMSYLDCATARERNHQIGGHKSGR